MFLGGNERWMLRFWTLRKLDATVLDALIGTRRRCMILPGTAAAAAGRDAGANTAALSAAGDVTAGRRGGAASAKCQAPRWRAGTAA